MCHETFGFRVRDWRLAGCKYLCLLEYEVMVQALVEVAEHTGISKHDIVALSFCLPHPHADQRYFTFIPGYLDLPGDDIFLAA